jgi:Na+/H+-dicarboxylate symporter
MDQSESVPGSDLTRRILIAMALGLGMGLALESLPLPASLVEFLVDGPLKVGGSVFLAGLKLLVVPLVFVSLVCGTAALDDIAKLGRLGLTTLALYMLTTAGAVLLALTLATVVAPGVGFELEATTEFVAPEAPSLADTLIALVPTNPIQAMAEGQMLQIIVFAILFGAALTLSGPQGLRVLDVFKDLDHVILRLVELVMAIAPIGVFCLVARVFADQGIEAFAPLMRYFVCVVAALLLHAAVTFSFLLRVLARRSPLEFFSAIRPVALVAFGTSSSNATIPVTLDTVENQLGVPESIAAFTVPLGATINMDGTAIMQGVATAFIAQAYGIELTASAWLSVVLTATLASVGTAGVPGVGLITLAMVLRSVGLPVEGIGLIMGVDRLLDMTRTAVNVTGDAAVTCVVAKLAGPVQQKG